MKIFIPDSLKNIAERLSAPLYIVGGYVRNFLIDGTVSSDTDIASPVSTKEFIRVAENLGYKTVAEYKRTGTAVIFDGERKFEYTRFRTDIYGAGGNHKPIRTEFTGDIELDARRRDFTCNAVYYDLLKGEIVDPLGGVNDIKNKILRTVKNPEEVFSSDGLRLMRLARFCGELNFTPTAEVIKGAKEYAGNIKDIAPERIYEELKKILVSDTKYPFSDKAGHYTALKLLEETGVFGILFPEISPCLSAVSYAEQSVRLAAMLFSAGESGAKDILHRLKADKNTAEKVLALIKLSSFDSSGEESEKAVRLFIAKNRDIFADLLKLKNALCSAERGEFSACPTAKKWQKVYEKMLKDGTPFTLKELKISAKDLIDTGFNGKEVGEELKRLFEFAVANAENNDEKTLREKATADFKLLRVALDKKEP